jgi:diguanylate cyclase (GGDEF)-like protein/PAS domain S-box-containing protein
MLTDLILAASTLVQFVTAYLALKLIKVTGNRSSWGLISLAISFMAVRRSISLFEFISGYYRYPLDLSFELVGLITSVLMLSGVVLISPLFKSMAHEIAQRKEAEKALRKTDKELSNITSNIGEGIFVFDKKGLAVFMNPEAERLLGWTMDELNEKGAHNLIHCCKSDGAPLPAEECNILKVMRTGERFHSRNEAFVRKDGTGVPVSVISAPIMEDGEIVASVAAFQDITELKQAENKLLEISLSDELTGLYNRRGFLSLIDQYIKIAKRQNKIIFVLYADVDNLKAINDKFGHLEGDEALRESAKILKETFRESDIIARIGGDEFAVISLEASQADMHRIVVRLQESLELYNSKSNHNYILSISWGISHWEPESLCSVDDVLSQADKSMYEQKKSKIKL